MKRILFSLFTMVAAGSALAGNYLSKELTFKNDTVTFGATLTVPRDVKRAPVAIILSGTGKQDRDGTMAGHKMFADIADYLRTAASPCCASTTGEPANRPASTRLRP